MKSRISPGVGSSNCLCSLLLQKITNLYVNVRETDINGNVCSLVREKSTGANMEPFRNM